MQLSLTAPARPRYRTIAQHSLYYTAPYGIFAGRDASRRLATFCLHEDALRDEYDDLSELNALQIQSDYVGRLLKPGQEPSEYTDEEASPAILLFDYCYPLRCWSP
uniref:Uncharacterized protein n=1 Tax=Strix occidentalis caurina TaxID=311401 RepID=A0A8D0EVP1_STROC